MMNTLIDIGLVSFCVIHLIWSYRIWTNGIRENHSRIVSQNGASQLILDLTERVVDLERDLTNAEEEIQKLRSALQPKSKPKQITPENDYAGFDWLYPILNDEERDIIDKAREYAATIKQQEQQEEL